MCACLWERLHGSLVLSREAVVPTLKYMYTVTLSAPRHLWVGFTDVSNCLKKHLSEVNLPHNTQT